MAGLQSGEGRMMIDSVVWAQYINLTDRQPRRHSEWQKVSDTKYKYTQFIKPTRVSA